MLAKAHGMTMALKNSWNFLRISFEVSEHFVCTSCALWTFHNYLYEAIPLFRHYSSISCQNQGKLSYAFPGIKELVSWIFLPFSKIPSDCFVETCLDLVGKSIICAFMLFTSIFTHNLELSHVNIVNCTLCWQKHFDQVYT